VFLPSELIQQANKFIAFNMARTRHRNVGKSRVQQVRVVDPYAGNDGLKVDRQLSHLQNSGGMVQITVTDSYAVNTQATDVAGNVTWSQVRLSDEFLSLAAQFNTFRIRSVRFDVYDLNPAAPAPGVFSTFHDEFTTGTQPVFSFNDVIDSADSQIVPPGTGKTSFTWMAHSTNERGYYDATPAVTSNGPDFGGLRYVLPAGTAATKYRIIVKAIVDFRGRR